MSGISSITSTGSALSIDSLVSTYMEVEKKPLATYKAKKENLTESISAYNNLKSELSGLNSILSGFTAAGAANLFAVKTAISSNESAFTVSADSTATAGVYGIFIEQTAKNDTAVSSRFKSSGTELASQLKNNSLEFEVSTASGSPVLIDFEMTDSKANNKELLQAIAERINRASAGIGASVVNDSADTVRLALVSKATGSSNALVLSDAGSGTVLNKLGFIDSGSLRPAQKNEESGFSFSDTDSLDARIILNGISITAGSNTIKDALPGITITLKKAQQSGEPMETISISGDSSGILSEIESFIDSYNSAIRYITKNSRTDAATNERGQFAGNYTTRSLVANLRSLAGGRVVSASAGNPQMLSEIGIKMNNDGTLSIADSSKLESLIESDPTQVTDLFASESGIAVKGQSLLKQFISTGGTLDTLEKGAKNKIRSIDISVKRLQEKLKIKENQLRASFAEIQKSLSMLNSQSTILQRLFGFTGSGSSSILSYSIY